MTGKVIEFVGLPTSGKTTLYKKVAENYPATDKVKIITLVTDTSPNKIYILFKTPLLIISNAGKMSALMFFFIKNGKANSFNAKLLFLTIKIFLLTKYKQKQNSILLADGVFHLLAAMQYKSVNIAKTMATFIQKNSHWYQAVVYVDITKEEFSKRFNERLILQDDFILCSYTAEQKQNYIDDVFARSLILKDVLTQDSSRPLLLLSGNESLENNAERVTRFISKYVT